MKAVSFLFLVAIFSVFAACQSQSPTDAVSVESAAVRDVSVADAGQAVAEKDAQFIDVRTVEEYKSGHAPGALNLPLDNLSNELGKLDKTKPVYVICQTGKRSAKGAEILNQAGFRQVFNITGGTSAWVAAGLPTETVSRSEAKNKLDDKTSQALLEALADERRAQAVYQAAMNKFGEVRPFVNIIEAEKRHEAMLLPLFEKYGVEVPKNEFEAAKTEVPATLTEVCRFGIKGEEENIALYDKFLGFVKEQDIREAFEYMRTASKQNHLPAFTRCAEGGNKSKNRPGRPF